MFRPFIYQIIHLPYQQYFTRAYRTKSLSCLLLKAKTVGQRLQITTVWAFLYQSTAVEYKLFVRLQFLGQCIFDQKSNSLTAFPLSHISCHMKEQPSYRCRYRKVASIHACYRFLGVFKYETQFKTRHGSIVEIRFQIRISNQISLTHVYISDLVATSPKILHL